MENIDAVKVKQLNSPVTMSPAGAGSGKGEGPRDTAGRSNLPTQARGRIREEESSGGRGAKKSISVAGRKTQRRQKAATTTVQDVTSGYMHSSRTTMGDKPRRVEEKKNC